MKICSQTLHWEASEFPHYPLLHPIPDFALISMENDHGIRMDILNYGCIIHRLEVPDQNDHPRNIVLSYPCPTDYFKNPAYINALIGRTAGRIGDGSFVLNNKTYCLNKNYGTTSAHGGDIGWNKKFFHFELKESSDTVSAIFYLHSPDMDEGYPGNVSSKITYTLNNNNEILIQFTADTDADTLLNLTQHTYFNLHGILSRDILSHELQIRSDCYAPIFENGVVTGTVDSVQDSPFDFRQVKTIGNDIESTHPQIQKGHGYDHFFQFEKDLSPDVPKISMKESASGIALELFTDCEGSILYSQNFPIENITTSDETAPTRRYIAIEPSAPPIGRNGEFIEYSILRKKERYQRFIRYRFPKIQKNI